MQSNSVGEEHTEVKMLSEQSFFCSHFAVSIMVFNRKAASL